jgi:hypothetical protein
MQERLFPESPSKPYDNKHAPCKAPFDFPTLLTMLHASMQSPPMPFFNEKYSKGLEAVVRLTSLPSMARDGWCVLAIKQVIQICTRCSDFPMLIQVQRTTARTVCVV